MGETQKVVPSPQLACGWSRLIVKGQGGWIYSFKAKWGNFLRQGRLLTASNCLEVKYSGCRIHCHVTSGVFLGGILPSEFPLSWHVRPHTRGSRTLLCSWSAEWSTERRARKVVQQHDAYTSPRRADPTSSGSSRRTPVRGRASGRSRGWPDLAAMGRVKMYGCSYGWDTEQGEM